MAHAVIPGSLAMRAPRNDELNTKPRIAPGLFI